MKFLVDAQLPVRLARFLDSVGHDALHTSELPNRNATPDSEIGAIAYADDRVVVTKDRDFRDSHLLRSTPRRLLIVATGNITNDVLLALFEENLDALVSALAEASFVEIGADRLVIHRDRVDAQAEEALKAMSEQAEDLGLYDE